MIALPPFSEGVRDDAVPIIPLVADSPQAYPLLYKEKSHA